MKFKKPVNENYCATVVKINNIIPLKKCDYIQSTTIFGNPIIIGKDTNIGDIGVYFPAETQLSHEYCYENNLYRHSELNKDQEIKGYIEDNRRIRTMKMRENKSCGLFMPLTSLLFCGIDINQYQIDDCFDEIKNTPICCKYVVVKKKSQGPNKQKEKKEKISRMIEGQFKFHEDTSHFGKNSHKFSLDDIISITYKMHGTSSISSKILCKKRINMFYKSLRTIGIKVIDYEYSNIYSSREVVKNDEFIEKNHYYKIDLWGLANDKLKEFIEDGMSIYYEIVGHLPSGKDIQTGYDYGCADNEFAIYIYRITYTSMKGRVFEFTYKQLHDWCKQRGLNAVPLLYYGTVKNLLIECKYHYTANGFNKLADNLIEALRSKYLEKDCFMCKNKVPSEGIVVRKEALDFEAYKFKSFKFLERETKLLDKGISDIEEEN